MSRGSLNKVMLIGNLGADPETRYMPNGNAVANVSIATSESWKDRNTGEAQERTEWHRVVFFGKLAEIVGQYLRKGSKIYVEGRIQTRKWQGQDGQDRWTTEIVVDQRGSMMMLDGRGGGGGTAPFDNQSGGQQQGGGAQGGGTPAGGAQGSGAPDGAAPGGGTPGGGAPDFDDDIPF